jgi:hypothetical protein
MSVPTIQKRLGTTTGHTWKKIMAIDKESLQQKLLACIKKTDNGCWEWTRSCNPNGYAQLGYKHRLIRAHRASAHAFLGLDLSSPLCVCHKCDNRKCINPNHLFIGTNQDNVDDKMRKGRLNPPLGSRSSFARLSENDIPLIRNRISSGEKLASIARAYKINPCAIWSIKHGHTWKHVN